MAAQVAFALGLALHQQLHTSCKHFDLALLTGNDFGQLIDRATEVGKGFFDRAHNRTSTKLFRPGQPSPKVTWG